MLFRNKYKLYSLLSNYYQNISYIIIDFKKYFEIIKFRKILCYDHKFFIDYNNNNNEKLNESYPKILIEYLYIKGTNIQFFEFCIKFYSLKSRYIILT